jgi:hypothetical protein
MIARTALADDELPGDYFIAKDVSIDMRISTIV